MLRRRNRISAALIALLAVGASPSFASSVFAFGLKIGYTSGQLRAKQGEGEYKVDKGSLSGGSFGLVGRIRLNDFLSLQPEVL